MKLLVGARVESDLWTRVKVFVAGCAGETCSGFVEKALEARLLAQQAPVDAIKEMEPARPKRPVTVKVPQPGAPKSSLADDWPPVGFEAVWCVNCFEQRQFHTGGQSGTLARNGCRQFREA